VAPALICGLIINLFVGLFYLCEINLLYLFGFNLFGGQIPRPIVLESLGLTQLLRNSLFGIGSVLL